MSQPSPADRHAPPPPDAAARSSCPYLGLRRDRATVYALPTDEHRCYAGGRARPVTAAYQATTCLTAAALECPRLPAAGTIRQAPVAPTVVPMPADDAAPPRPPVVAKGARRIRVALGLAAVVVLSVVLPVVMRGFIQIPQPLPVADQPLPVAVATATVSVPSVTSGPTATVSVPAVASGPTATVSVPPVASGRGAIMAASLQVTATPGVDKPGGTGAEVAPSTSSAVGADSAASVEGKGTPEADPTRLP